MFAHHSPPSSPVLVGALTKSSQEDEVCSVGWGGVEGEGRAHELCMSTTTRYPLSLSLSAGEKS